MNTRISPLKGYLLAAMIGAVGGGLLVALATKAVPMAMSKMMSGIMLQMMGQIRKNGFDPTEMCKKVMKGFAESQPEEVPSSRVE
jgi:hypothetical protein